MKRVILVAILIFFGLMMVGCTRTSTNVVNTNRFYQSDYNYFCFDGDKTWSQIVVCLDAENKAEKTQNKVTNEMLDNAQ